MPPIARYKTIYHDKTNFKNVAAAACPLQVVQVYNISLNKFSNLSSVLLVQNDVKAALALPYPLSSSSMVSHGCKSWRSFKGKVIPPRSRQASYVTRVRKCKFPRNGRRIDKIIVVAFVVISVGSSSPGMMEGDSRTENRRCIQSKSTKADVGGPISAVPLFEAVDAC